MTTQFSSKAELEKTVQAFHDLLQFSFSEVSLCPWINQQTMTNFLMELKSEIDEVKLAKTNDEVLDELGDLFRDALFTLILAVKEGKAPSLGSILRHSLKKVQERKPWVLQGKSVSLQEAKRIWSTVKKLQKQRD